MASIAYPSSATRPNLWTFNKAQAKTNSYKGWPSSSETKYSKSNEGKTEEANKEVSLWKKSNRRYRRLIVKVPEEISKKIKNYCLLFRAEFGFALSAQSSFLASRRSSN